EPGERHLGLHHPELRQMAPRLRLLGAKGGPEDVHLAERQRARFRVELSALRQVGSVAEVLDGEQRRRPLAGGRRQDGRVEADEAVPSRYSRAARITSARIRSTACWRLERSQRWRCSSRKAVPWSL